jgi:Tol biopolymer transport system component
VDNDRQLRSEFRRALDAVLPPAPWLDAAVRERLRETPGTEGGSQRRSPIALRWARVDQRLVAAVLVVLLASAAVGVILLAQRAMSRSLPAGTCIASRACPVPRATPSATPANTLPTHGRIVFQLAFGPTGNDSNIFTIEPDGSGLLKLTNVATGQGHPGDTAWAPTWDRIFFDNARATSSHLFSMDPSGGSVRQLTTGSLFEGDPAISPDGTQVAFDRSGGPRPPTAAIFLMNTDGSHITRVTTPPKSARDGDTSPVFSPDGTQLAFVRDGAIYIVGVDGSGLRQVTPASLVASRPQWSPDGSKIAFGTSDQANVDVGQNVHVVNVDGSGLVALTHELSPDSAEDPTWSPDGSMIAFTRFRSELVDHYIAIVVMHADGSKPIEIWHPTPNTDNFAGALSWGRAS